VKYLPHDSVRCLIILYQKLAIDCLFNGACVVANLPKRQGDSVFGKIDQVEIILQTLAFSSIEAIQPDRNRMTMFTGKLAKSDHPASLSFLIHVFSNQQF
jgi:hypothetical protein